MRRKILFLSSWYPNKIEPFHGNFVQRHAEAVSTIHDVEVLHAVDDPQQKQKYLIEENTVNGIKTVIVYYKTSKFSPLNFYRRMKAYELGYSKMRSPDLIHANVLHNSMLFALWIKKKYKISFVVSEHWTGFLDINKSKLSKTKILIAKRIANESEFVLPVSKMLKKGLERIGIEKNIFVVGNVIDTNTFIINKCKNANTFTFLHISCLVSWKNPDKIIHVANKLRKSFQNFELHIGGDGDLDSLREKIHKTQSDDYIKIFGAISLVEVAKKMRNSHCFILFSDFETFSCVILESLSSGTPVIATRVGVAPEVIHDENGILINVSEEELYDAMKKMLENRNDFTDSEKYHLEIKEQYSPSKVANQFNEVYQKLWKN